MGIATATGGMNSTLRMKNERLPPPVRKRAMLYAARVPITIPIAVEQIATMALSIRPLRPL